MLTEEVIITTKTLKTNEIFKVILNSPTGKRKGRIFLEKLDVDFKTKVGTKIEFIYKTEKISSSYSSGLSNSFYSEYDPLMDEEFDFEIENLNKKIDEFQKNSIVPIFSNKSIEMSLRIEEEFKLVANGKLKIYFEEISKDKSYSLRDSNKLYFRGQLIGKTSYFPIRILNKFYKIHINLLGWDAKEALGISRDRLKDQFISKIENEIIEGLIEYIKIEKEKFKDEYVKFFLGLFYKNIVDKMEEQKKKFPEEFKEFYKEYKFKNEMSIKKLLEEKALTIEYRSHSLIENRNGKLKLNNESFLGESEILKGVLNILFAEKNIR